MTDARQVETELVSIVQTGESFHAKGQYDSRYLTTDWRIVNPTTVLTPQGPIGKSNFHLHWPLALGPWPLARFIFSQPVMSPRMAGGQFIN